MEYIRGRFKRFAPGRWSQEPNLSPPKAPPALLVERPRPLTATTPNATATTGSSFFQVLPSEIRRRIIVEAFGERALHLDLRLEHPLKKSSKIINSRSKRHANSQLFHPSLRDTSQRREWVWWSCVCHRSASSESPLRYPPGLDPPGYEPARDRCRDPTGPHDSCECYPGKLPEKCFIGALSWLLVCRQAYVEGVDVLYSTNRFHFAYAELAIYLPHLLLPQRLAAIKDVELSWDPKVDSGIYLGVMASHSRNLRFSERLSILARLPEVLPNLRYLYITLNLSSKAVFSELVPSMVIYGPEMYEASEEILRLIDGVVSRMPQLQDCRVALPSTWYGTRKVTEKGQDIAWSFPECLEPEALWREVSITSSNTQVSANSPAVGGYWIVHGQRDMQPLFSEV